MDSTEVEAALANVRAAMDPKVPGHLGLLRMAESQLVAALDAVRSPQGEDHEAGRARFGLCEIHGRVPVAIGSHDQAEICPYCGRDLYRVSAGNDERRH